MVSKLKLSLRKLCEGVCGVCILAFSAFICHSFNNRRNEKRPAVAELVEVDGERWDNTIFPVVNGMVEGLL